MNDNSNEKIFELISVLQEISDYEEILSLITDYIAITFNTLETSVIMLNPHTEKTIKTVFKQKGNSDTSKSKLLHDIVTGWILKNNKTFFSKHHGIDPSFHKHITELSTGNIVLCSPLKNTGKIIGAIFLMFNKNKPDLIYDEINRLERNCMLLSPYLYNAQSIMNYFNPPMTNDTLITKYKELNLIGNSNSFIELLKSIEIASKCSVRVMIQGKSGTGKELVAKAIHKLSDRNENKFIAIDCGAIPAHLIESELFGFAKGAFTGAERERKGLLEEANGGTFFMDEITNLPFETQSKLLRVLQENEIRPLGSNETKKIDLRIISASSSSIKDFVEEGKFREDLYYRLHVYPIFIPSLEERREDIPILAKHFLDIYCRQQKKNILDFSDEIISAFLNYSWKGNIRELENVIERMVTMVPNDTEKISPDYLPEELKNNIDINIKLQKESLPDLLESYEAKLLTDALEKAEWNQSEAARELGIPEQTLRYKMKKLDISGN